MWRTKDVFGFGVNEKTYPEIAEIEGCSRERSRQLMLTAIKKIQFRIEMVKQRMGQPQVVIKYVEKKPEPCNLPIIYKPVDALGEMTVRTANCLYNENIKTIEQLIRKREGEMMCVPNFGRKSLNELRELLAKQELSFGMNE